MTDEPTTGQLVTFRGGFELDPYKLFDWSPRFTMTLEGPDDDLQVVCWVGTFWLVTDEGGGMMGQGDGVAVGVDHLGQTWVDPAWEDRFKDFPEFDPDRRPVPLWVVLESADALAKLGRFFAHPVRREIEAGRDFDEVVAETAADPQLGDHAELASVAVGLLWCAIADRVNKLRDT